MIKLDLYRFNHNDTTSLGLLYLNDQFQCFTLEDEPRLQKIYGKTRIPSGSYQIKFREAGKLHEKYKTKFSFHQGMLWLQDVPNFEFIYIHIGNTHLDTLGCILVGDGVTIDGARLTNSTIAYSNLYKKILALIKKDVSHETINFDFKINIFDENKITSKLVA